MFDRVLDMPLHNNLLQLIEGLRRSFPPLGLGKGILDSRSLVISLINTKNKKMESWTHPTSPFPWATTGAKRQNIWSSFIYSFFCARPFDQKLACSLIYFVHFHTTIRVKYMVLFHLFFLLCTIIRPKVKLLIDLFISFTHDHSTEIYGPLSFVLSFVQDYWPKNRVFVDLFFLFAHDHSTKICSSCIYSFFVHDHSTKN